MANPNNHPSFPLALNWPIGVQPTCEWVATDETLSKTLLTTKAPENYVGLLDVAVQGRNVLLRVTFGTSRTVILQNIRPPFRCGMIGDVQIEASKIDPSESAFAKVSVALVQAAPRTVARVFVSGAGVLPDATESLTALSAVVLSVAGVAVAVAAGEMVPIVSPASMVSGDAVLDMEL